MNPIIEQLLVQLCITCLQITAQGKLNAHFNLYAHTKTVSISLEPAECDYSSAEAIRAAQVLRINESYERNYDWETPEEDLTTCINALEGALAALQPYLQPTVQEAA